MSFSFTILKIYDFLENEVATLVNEEKPAGSYEAEFSVGQNVFCPWAAEYIITH